MTLSCHLLIPARALTLISVLGVTSLIGCQTIDNSKIEPITAKAPKPVDTDERIITFPQSADNEYIGSWKLPELSVERHLRRRSRLHAREGLYPHLDIHVGGSSFARDE